MSTIKLADVPSAAAAEAAIKPPSPANPAQSKEAARPDKTPAGMSMPSGWVLAALASCAFGVLPLLLNFGQRLWSIPHYQFFPLPIALAAWLGWHRTRDLGPLTPGDGGRTRRWLIGCWLLVLLAVAAFAPTLGAIAAVLLAGALIYDVGGGRLFRALLPAWLLLWLVIPLPFGGDERLVNGLQAIASRCASPLLDLFSIFHISSGNIVNTGRLKPYFIEQACSGIQSLLPTLAVTIFWVFWKRRPIIHGVLLVLAAVGWVLAANAVRITSVVVLQEKWDINVASGWRHDMLGLVLFAAALALIWSTDQLLMYFSTPRVLPGMAPAPAPAQGPTACPRLAESCFLSVWTVAAFGALGLLQTLVFWPVEPLPSTAIATRFGDLSGKELEPLLSEFKSLKSDGFVPVPQGEANMNAKTSYLWKFHDGGIWVQVELDYAYEGWHDLSLCYRSAGWKMVERKRQPFSTKDDRGQHGLMEARLEKSVSENGWLLWSMIDDHGQLLNPPRTEFIAEQWDRIAHRPWTLAGRRAMSQREWFAPTYQVQMLVGSDRPLNDSEKDTYESFFWQARRLLMNHGPRDDQ